uniref:Protein kinase domain-containing protein n=1 Tax=Leersia perrieri TaxID=77586 RepID=A0A0D9WZ09_9ORYZ
MINFQSFRDTAKEVLAKADIDPNVKCFTRRQMTRITNNYSTVLGNGGFSVVYKGRLNDGRSVAAKQYNWRTQKKEFMKEVIIQSQFSDKNIVRASLIGNAKRVIYCPQADAPILVTEFVHNGNLSDLLHGNSDPLPVSLETHLRIATDVAEALNIPSSWANNGLSGYPVPIFSTLLGDKHLAKLCDFGISRLLCMDSDEYTGFVIGSRGYMDPVYRETGRLSPKLIFGVVLLELITRKKGLDDMKVCLAETFTRASRNNRHELFDNEIATNENIEFIQGVADLALDCLKSELEDRPQMKEVLEQLWGLKRKMLEQQTKIAELERASAVLTEPRVVALREIKAMLQEAGFKNFITKNKIDAIIGDSEQVSTSETFSGKRIVLTECAMGKVYLGHLKNISVVVIKMSAEVDEDWKQKFFKEMIRQFVPWDTNVARFFGCCLDHVDAPVLVYEYGVMNLHDSLFGNGWQHVRRFNCKARLEIAVGAAQGLVHLHSHNMVHGDVRTANVLFDKAPYDFYPFRVITRISGFGMAKLLDKARYARFLTENVCYKDPEFLKTGVMAKENNVYGFGIVLLELFTQKKIEMHDVNTLLEKEYGYDASYHVEEIKELASKCLAPKVTERPSMDEVAICLRVLSQDLPGDRNSPCPCMLRC